MQISVLVNRAAVANPTVPHGIIGAATGVSISITGATANKTINVVLNGTVMTAIQMDNLGNFAITVPLVAISAARQLAISTRFGGVQWNIHDPGGGTGVICSFGAADGLGSITASLVYV